jgi:hypothetical protein
MRKLYGLDSKRVVRAFRQCYPFPEAVIPVLMAAYDLIGGKPYVGVARYSAVGKRIKDYTVFAGFNGKAAMPMPGDINLVYHKSVLHLVLVRHIARKI